MKRYRGLISFILLISFVFQGVFVKGVKAADAENNIILLIDNSGSMRDTDPKRLSLVAASMLIDSIDENTNLNIVPFGDKPLAQYRLAMKPSKEALKKELTGINFDSNFTDMKEGLSEALLEMDKLQGDKSVILLSDGKEDPAGGLTKEHSEEFSALIEKAHLSGVKVNCIGLSQAADKESLANIAFKTGGQFYYSNNPSELFSVFSKLLGNMDDFYTVQEYTVEGEAAKEVKLSSFVEQATIKIASFDNKTPMVSVEEDKKELEASKLGDGYKIYSVKNDKDSTINILPRDKGKYSIIVQVKSRASLNITSTDNNFTVPMGIPVTINAALKVDKEIIGLHMDKVEDNSREPISKGDNGFVFTLNKAKSGQYSILITAYDGEGRIIAVNNLNVNVTDYPPFYFANPLPGEMIVEKPYRIELKQLNDLKVISPSGDIIVDYGDKQEEFPLKFVDNVLVSEVTLHKLQGVKLTASINGVYNNESFSYYLPYTKVKAVEKPFIDIEAVKTKVNFRQNQAVNLTLNIKAMKLYKDERVTVYDVSNNKLGEFIVPANIKNSASAAGNAPYQIKVSIQPKELGKNLILKLKAEDGVRVTESIKTEINVLSKFDYYFAPFRLPLYFLIALILVFYCVKIFGRYQYKRYRNYVVSKELNYRLSSRPGNYFLTLTLSPEENVQYLNYKSKSVELEAESNNEIGCFSLSLPKGNELMKGIKYFLYKDKVFSIEYYPAMEQQVYKEEEEVEGSLTYGEDVKIIVRNKKEEIIICFS